jgi:Type II secretion system (T2SS), protein M subtype b
MSVPWRSLALVGLAPLAVLALAAGLWRDADAAETEADAARARLAHALSRPAPSPEAAAMELLIPGDSAGLAGSAFQALVLARVQPSGAQVLEVAAAPAEPLDALTRLHLTLQVQATEAQVAAALVALEGAEPLIAVDRLDVQAGGDGGVLSATLTLSAWAGKVVP